MMVLSGEKHTIYPYQYFMYTCTAIQLFKAGVNLEIICPLKFPATYVHIWYISSLDCVSSGCN